MFLSCDTVRNETSGNLSYPWRSLVTVFQVIIPLTIDYGYDTLIDYEYYLSSVTWLDGSVVISD